MAADCVKPRIPNSDVPRRPDKTSTHSQLQLVNCHYTKNTKRKTPHLLPDKAFHRNRVRNYLSPHTNHLHPQTTSTNPNDDVNQAKDKIHSPPLTLLYISWPKQNRSRAWWIVSRWGHQVPEEPKHQCCQQSWHVSSNRHCQECCIHGRHVGSWWSKEIVTVEVRYQQ